MEKEQFDKLAAFNKFRLDGPAQQRLAAALDASLDFLSPLCAADFGDTPLLVHASGVAPVYRDDRADKQISREQILANAPEQAEHCFAVPRVAD